MRKIPALIIVLLGAFIAKAQHNDFEWYKKIEKVKGKISVLENKEPWVILPDDNPSGRYISSQLPEEYKKDGLKITFTGWVGKIPPNFRMIGTPLKLTCIYIAKTEQQKFKLKKCRYIFK